MNYDEFSSAMGDQEWAQKYYDVSANDFHWEGHIEKLMMFIEGSNVFSKDRLIVMFLPTLILNNKKIVQRIERSLSSYFVQVLPSYVQYKSVFQTRYSVLNDQLIIEMEYNSYVAYFIEQNATAKRQTALLSSSQVMEYCKPLVQDLQDVLMLNAVVLSEEDKRKLLHYTNKYFSLWSNVAPSKLELSDRRSIDTETIHLNNCLNKVRNKLLSDALLVTCSDFSITKNFVMNLVIVGVTPLAKYLRKCRKYHFPSVTKYVDEFPLFCNVLNKNILFFIGIERLPPLLHHSLVQPMREILEEIMCFSKPLLSWGELCQKGFTLTQKDSEDYSELRIENTDTNLGISLFEKKSSQNASKEKYFIPGVIPSYFSMNDSAVEDESRVVIGALKDGLYDGPCNVYYISKPLVYSGNLQKGKRNGFGSVLYSGRLIWKGQYSNDQIEGNGYCFATDGTSYVGDFRNGEFHGIGCLMHCGDEVNTGGFCSGTWEGFHFVSSPQAITYGQIRDNSWNQDVIRLRQNGSVVVDFYRGGVLENYSVGFNSYSMISTRSSSTNHSGGSSDGTIDEVIDDEVVENGSNDTEVVPDSSEDKTAVTEKLAEEAWSDLEGDDQENRWVCEVEHLLSQNRKFDESELISIQNQILNKEETVDKSSSSTVEPNLFSFSKDGGKIEWFIKNEGRFWDSNNVLLYEGHFEKETFCGRGTLFYPDGMTWYEGEFKNDKPHGKGKLYYPNGCLRYDGEWRDGQMNGKGSLFKPINFKYANSAIRSYVWSHRNDDKHLSFVKDFSRYSDFLCV